MTSQQELEYVLVKQQYEDDDHYNIRIKLVEKILNNHPSALTPEDANAISMALLNASYYDAEPTDDMKNLINIALK